QTIEEDQILFIRSIIQKDDLIDDYLKRINPATLLSNISDSCSELGHFYIEHMSTQLMKKNLDDTFSLDVWKNLKSNHGLWLSIEIHRSTSIIKLLLEDPRTSDPDGFILNY